MSGSIRVCQSLPANKILLLPQGQAVSRSGCSLGVLVTECSAELQLGSEYVRRGPGDCLEWCKRVEERYGDRIFMQSITPNVVKKRKGSPVKSLPMWGFEPSTHGQVTVKP